MSCSKGFTILANLLLTAAFIAVLFPEIYWAKVGNDKISLWKNCSSTDGTDTTLTCDSYGLSKHDMEDEHKAMLDGCRASCVLASCFALLGAAVLACNRNRGAIFTAFLVAIFATTAVGTFVEFTRVSKVTWEGGASDGTHQYKPWVGTIIVSCSLVLSYLTVISSCCVPRGSGYESIA